ncbi:MAG TPA: hypothetical protein QF873_01400, partial [Patescibacteria group bacterium]|nr:hypothetical protein [Patescibacteria group bacterium]
AKSWKRFEGDFLLALAFLGALSFYAGIGLCLVEIEENDPVVSLFALGTVCCAPMFSNMIWAGITGLLSWIGAFAVALSQLPDVWRKSDDRLLMLALGIIRSPWHLLQLMAVADMTWHSMYQSARDELDTPWAVPTKSK